MPEEHAGVLELQGEVARSQLANIYISCSNRLLEI